jgi:ketosteroid isomerase-like protein
MDAVTAEDSRIAKVLAALQSGDGSQIQAICHPEMIVEDPASLPYGGVYKGFEGMIECAGKLFAAVVDCKIETLEIIGDPGGDAFVLRQRLTGRAARSGRPIDTTILEHYAFRDGLLVSIRPYYWDTKAMAEILAGGAG